MFDARFATFAAASALLVISPGATLAVVLEAALGDGRRAALLTVLGVGLGNATWALATTLGMSWLVSEWPAALSVVRVAGAIYLTWLGLRGLWRAVTQPAPAATDHSRSDFQREARSLGGNHSGSDLSAGQGRPGNYSGSDLGAAGFVGRGMLTNLLNPPVILFYLTFLPQFVGPQDPVLARLALLGATHVAMSIVWQGSCGLAAAVAADRLARPAVRRTLEGLTGAVLVVLGARLLF
jgi:threonine/homoserine/homoserine lactone efflux protein